MTYDPRQIEAKWQRLWEERGTFRVETRTQRKTYYVLDMFPYPSGHGLHVGHLKGYVASDAVARYRRMRGYAVLHPMGWDSFGLPTERQAERDGLHPAEVTRRNVDVFRRQLRLVGLSFDWSRELTTSEPDYYRWTQWIFLQLHQRGLAYEAEVPVNWCPALGTVLANEEVKDGRYVYTGDVVERRVMRQWMLRITAYADRLLDDLAIVDWPDNVKELQRDWIGRREGVTVRFQVADRSEVLDVFTTRVDTLFGCTFCVLAPEHPLATQLATPEHAAAVAGYVARAAALSERDRQTQVDSKTGVFTGSYAVNPANHELVPIWIADYVLPGYGTGAIFACPAHDERDHAMARAFGLPIVPVIAGGDVAQAPTLADGPHVNSAFLDGLTTAPATAAMAAWLVERGLGERKVTYHLRDWLFSRQRYWGEPIPIVHLSDGRAVAAPELPVVLPDALRPPRPGEEIAPPLARAPDEWLRVARPEPGVRETNVMPQWAGSSWYYLRFLDPGDRERPWDPELERNWLPVDLYVGGVEHATLHLLYARFWHKVLHDCGLVASAEPFQRLFNQGMVHARSFRDEAGRYYYPHEVAARGDGWVSVDGERPLHSRMEKMSKSRYNTVSPEEVVEKYGADTLRLFELFMGPVEENVVWQAEGLPGARRFLERAWKLFAAGPAPDGDAIDEALERVLHATIRKVTEDLDHLQLNTAISQLMILVNEAGSRPRAPRSVLEALALLLAPFAPHFAEEVWSMLGHEDVAALAPWPSYDPLKCLVPEVVVAVQVDGRMRGRIQLPRDAPEETARAAALADAQIGRYTAGKTIVRVVYVPNRLLNLLVS